MTVHGPILRKLLLHPFRTFMMDDTRSYRGYQILAAVLHLANELEPKCKSQNLGLLLPTGGAFPIAALAGWILGKTIVPLNYLLKPEELKYVIQDCETDTIISVGPMLEHLGHRLEVPNLI